MSLNYRPRSHHGLSNTGLILAMMALVVLQHAPFVKTSSAIEGSTSKLGQAVNVYGRVQASYAFYLNMRFSDDCFIVTTEHPRCYFPRVDTCRSKWGQRTANFYVATGGGK